MAISRTLAMGSSLLLAESLTNAGYLSFPVHDSTDRPTEFKDGLPTYVKLTKDFGESDEAEGALEQFLLCTSCTISYIFGKKDELSTGGTTEQMIFKTGSEPVPVTFVDTNLQLYEDDDPLKPINFNMQVGWIDP